MHPVPTGFNEYEGASPGNPSAIVGLLERGRADTGEFGPRHGCRTALANELGRSAVLRGGAGGLKSFQVLPEKGADSAE